MIRLAVERSKSMGDETYSSLLRLRAEWLNESIATDQERMEAWVEYLEQHPADLNAIEALEPYIVSNEDWSILASLYERALPLRKAGKVRILEHLFHIYTERLKQSEKAAQVQQSILEFNPSNEEAGSWLTLYYAERQEWNQLLDSCELWTPEITHHPVWLEAKLRALIGLENLKKHINVGLYCLKRVLKDFLSSRC